MRAPWNGGGICSLVRSAEDGHFVVKLGLYALLRDAHCIAPHRARGRGAQGFFFWRIAVRSAFTGALFFSFLQHSYQLAQLATGLDLLNQADPCVQVSVTDAGEHLLTAAGEMHLELCLRDLRERYAKIDVEASAPIVPFRESISNEPGRNPELKVGAATTADHQVTITVQVLLLQEMDDSPLLFSLASGACASRQRDGILGQESRPH